MSQKTILVIDDSATIRRLVDSTLSPAGYRVVLTANAEDGVREAGALQPDMILLDHQLPGTTGFEVCQSLLASAETKSIPVVVSSTLRKKAYAEYTDLANVVDMLPKPYSGELLTTTVSNALSTGTLIVESQSQGTAVPEVIGELDNADLEGTFAAISLREVLDFLNNGSKTGVLEVELDNCRVWYYVNDGRLQAVTSTGTDPSRITGTLPDSLADLAPVLNLTVGGRLCSELDGLVELLDRKVLDPRLLRKLLRHQAAMLTRECFVGKPKQFRFQAGRLAPPLFRKLPLDISLAALLVEGASRCDEGELPDPAGRLLYVRRVIRGQNLDRAGLSPNHMKLLGTLSEPIGVADLARRLAWEPAEVRRVLHGLCLADLVQTQNRGSQSFVIALDNDAAGLRMLRAAIEAEPERYTGKVVRDRLALQLLLRRSQPDVLILPLTSDADRELALGLRVQFEEKSPGTRWVGIVDGPADTADLPFECDALLERPFGADEALKALDTACADAGQPDASDNELAAVAGAAN
ncbi:response regulator [Maioricimonas sp. JC845]|uniref:response regulator n=1 Tax=Maioricimonas sp. JC845 TaxID=3232138 RepID=UPI003458829C